MGAGMPVARPNRRWIWFFVVVIVLSVGAVGSLIAYNLRQQLKPEQLEAARRLWADKRLASYQLSYSVKKGTDSSVDSYVVRVRAGRVVSVSLNGQPVEKRLFRFYGMEAFFDNIADFLKVDAEPGTPRTYTRAIFDPDTGALRQFVRRVMGGGPRLEITVDSLLPLEDASP